MSDLNAIARTAEASRFASDLHHHGWTESFLMFLNRADEDPSGMFARLNDHLRMHDSRVVRMDSIGLLNTAGTHHLQQRYCCDCRECPLNGTDAEGRRVCPVTGLYVQIVKDLPVEPVWLGGRIVGTMYEDTYARYCHLNEVYPDSRLPRERQALQVFERMESALKHVGMEFSHVVRTWLFIEDILDWYETFNRERDRFFSERSIYDGLVPASTGVGGSNQFGSAIVGSLTAVLPKREMTRIEAVPSPLQGAALEYGSSFNRAVEVQTPEHRRLLVSGTASIAPTGETLHVGDVDSQVKVTMEVVEAILQSRQMDWNNVTRGAAYFKDLADLPVYDRYCARRRMPRLPVAVVQNDVCRNDLLFEIEVDAIVPLS